MWCSLLWLILCKVHTLGVNSLTNVLINVNNKITMISQWLAMRNILLTLQRKKRLPAGIYMITSKGQGVLFFTPHLFFVGRTEDRDVMFIFCPLLPWKTWQWYDKTRTWILLFKVRLLPLPFLYNTRSRVIYSNN